MLLKHGLSSANYNVTTLSATSLDRRLKDDETPSSFLTSGIQLYPITGGIPTGIQDLASDEDISVLEEFAHHVLANVVGRTYYKRQKRSSPMSSWASISDEAYALICLENSEEVWLEEKTTMQYTKDSGQDTKKRKQGKLYSYIHYNYCCE